MRFDIMTLFPDMITAFTDGSILGRAQKSGLIEVHVHNIRDFTLDKHRKVDDTPYGGGMGMLMTVQPIVDCFKSFENELPENRCVIYVSPKGKVFDHKKALDLSSYDSIVILCGHYEGIDARVEELIIDELVSVGDFVLTGGELPALIIVDAVSRLIQGVLSDDVCFEDESIASGLLEYPQYTKPASYMGLDVPDVLLKGNHNDITKWRREQALKQTVKFRPDLIHEENLTKDDILLLEKDNSQI